MFYDYHMHSSFSNDSKTDMEEMVKKSIELGLNEICFTDHVDYDLDTDFDWGIDYDKYFERLNFLQNKYHKEISIKKGIELGLQKQITQKCSEDACKYPFDFIIGSTHRFDKLDAEDKRHYESVSIQEACEHYFEQELLNLKGFKNCDAVGHMDFVLRYCPGAVEYFSYSKFADVLDEILREIINSGRGLECNTSKFVAKNMINPNLEIFKRYFELGGEIVTFGSDAHTPNRIGEGFNEISEKLKSIGLKYYAVYRNHVPEFLKV
ncbi:Histidinol-phosphatase [bioreactor metagenome]|uniref:histidinol-phosphatase n=1 Tax=bioreactor metagenome TaxID=1076179 RepID=A0A645AIK4_9ZZZZ